MLETKPPKPRQPGADSLRALLAIGLALLLCAALAGCGRVGKGDARTLKRDEATRRSTQNGEVVGGFGAHGAQVWLGIPFAKPPLNKLRWRAPEAPENWDGVFEALEHGAPCPQIASPLGGRTDFDLGDFYGSEDCLVLNIFNHHHDHSHAATPDAAARPVMVWIHGGGNVVGDASLYDGSRLAQENDVLVVALQYRLGPFGWFRHKALRDGADAQSASGNFGALDLLRALEWVQQNISHFGGDPNNVTLFGESAGGTNIFALLLSSKSEGLFHRAIAQSGTPRLLPPDAGEFPEAGAARGNTSSEIVRHLLDKDAQRPAAQVAAMLRAKPAYDVLRAYAEQETDIIEMPRLFADGVVLPEGDAKSAFAAGLHQRVPVILGSNRDESKLFQVADRELVTWMLGMPFFSKDPVHYDRVAEYSSKWWKLAGVDEPARVLHPHGPVWAYRFDWDEEPSFLWWDFPHLLGAAHALEIPFVFGNFDLGRLNRALWDDDTRESREQLSRQMRSYWSAFAWRGDPGRGRDGELPEWTPWDESRPTADRFLLFDSEADGGLRMSADALTHALILDQIAADPRFSSSEERCALLDNFARQRRMPFDETERRRAGCEETPAE